MHRRTFALWRFQILLALTVLLCLPLACTRPQVRVPVTDTKAREELARGDTYFAVHHLVGLEPGRGRVCQGLCACPVGGGQGQTAAHAVSNHDPADRRGHRLARYRQDSGRTLCVAAHVPGRVPVRSGAPVPGRLRRHLVQGPSATGGPAGARGLQLRRRRPGRLSPGTPPPHLRAGAVPGGRGPALGDLQQLPALHLPQHGPQDGLQDRRTGKLVPGLRRALRIRRGGPVPEVALQRRAEILRARPHAHPGVHSSPEWPRERVLLCARGLGQGTRVLRRFAAAGSGKHRGLVRYRARVCYHLGKHAESNESMVRALQSD